MAGIKLEDMFRAKYSLKKEDDLFQLIETAIMVAVFEKKDEFRKRKARILHILNTETPHDDQSLSGSGDSDGELPQTGQPVAAAADLRSVNSGQSVSGFQENNNGIQEKQRPNSAQEKRESGIDEKRFAVSERKFQQSCRDLEKRKRKIQLLESKDVPILPMFEKSGRGSKKIRF